MEGSSTGILLLNRRGDGVESHTSKQKHHMQTILATLCVYCCEFSAKYRSMKTFCGRHPSLSLYFRMSNPQHIYMSKWCCACASVYELHGAQQSVDPHVSPCMSTRMRCVNMICIYVQRLCPPLGVVRAKAYRTYSVFYTRESKSFWNKLASTQACSSSSSSRVLLLAVIVLE